MACWFCNWQHNLECLSPTLFFLAPFTLHIRLHLENNLQENCQSKLKWHAYSVLCTSLSYNTRIISPRYVEGHSLCAATLFSSKLANHFHIMEKRILTLQLNSSCLAMAMASLGLSITRPCVPEKSIATRSEQFFMFYKNKTKAWEWSVSLCIIIV